MDQFKRMGVKWARSFVMLHEHEHAFNNKVLSCLFCTLCHSHAFSFMIMITCVETIHSGRSGCNKRRTVWCRKAATLLCTQCEEANKKKSGWRQSPSLRLSILFRREWKVHFATQMNLRRRFSEQHRLIRHRRRFRLNRELIFIFVCLKYRRETQSNVHSTHGGNAMQWNLRSVRLRWAIKM